ncbi:MULTISPECIES: dihydroneopterin aldolase [Acetobacter]|uniref:7,8-dihydroneopterin aldolase n=2 Tax=Acetobacter TaxID=434 RepID=A0AB33IAM0_ACEAC|nr:MULTISPECIES: dihydroneopterin aldolase [Acetobacter]GBO79501.1 dihydroneopterin aldolase [Acetobacter aceti NRIC 0242]MCE0745092.1 dihydroneopterin aldolase [Acetobacter sicerae]MCH4090794.1 dihydroneopterin aldolase [Acetobacter sp.]MCI1300490.1 dihydroneopterin aldolase [Acetobacter sp.]MCI1316308.1 dihydroneopterin aldolase [Acetobacter sp.]
MTILAPWPADLAVRRLFLKDMIVDAYIGVFPHEQGVTQRVRINVSFGVDDSRDLTEGVDDLSRTVSYETAVLTIRRLATETHTQLVETLAERIAIEVMKDRRVRVVRISVEKLDIFSDLDSVGVEIERWATE